VFKNVQDIEKIKRKMEMKVNIKISYFDKVVNLIMNEVKNPVDKKEKEYIINKAC